MRFAGKLTAMIDFLFIMNRGTVRRLYFFLASLFLCNYFNNVPVFAEEALLLATTTSTQSSGLMDVLVPEFKKDTGIHIKVLAKGTGAALRDGMDGNVDVLLVHDPQREEKFVREGYGIERFPVMHNDFVLVGPAPDPAGIRGAISAAQALRMIAESRELFISRGDDSGTHTKEQVLWKQSGMALLETKTEVVKKGSNRTIRFIRPAGDWYLSIGQGMGKTLTFGEEKQAYTLCDRGTYLKYRKGRKQGLDLEILFEGDKILFNPYGVIPVNPKKHKHVKHAQAVRFARWLVSRRGQSLIAGYRIHHEQLFYPDAVPDAG